MEGSTLVIEHYSYEGCNLGPGGVTVPPAPDLLRMIRALNSIRKSYLKDMAEDLKDAEILMYLWKMRLSMHNDGSGQKDNAYILNGFASHEELQIRDDDELLRRAASFFVAADDEGRSFEVGEKKGFWVAIRTAAGIATHMSGTFAKHGEVIHGKLPVGDRPNLVISIKNFKLHAASTVRPLCLRREPVRIHSLAQGVLFESSKPPVGTYAFQRASIAGYVYLTKGALYFMDIWCHLGDDNFLE